jgi:WD40 repeat protein
MDWIDLLVNAIAWLGHRTRLDKFSLLWLNRSAAKLVCEELNIRWQVLKPVFADPRVVKRLYKDQYFESDEQEIIGKVVMERGLLEKDALERFLDRFTEEAINKMEDSLWWRKRAEERARRLLSRPKRIERTGTHNFFSTSPKVRFVPSNKLIPRRETHQLLDALLGRQPAEQSGVTVGLFGPPGHGKATLAMEVCGRADVQAKYSDGTLWIPLSDDNMGLNTHLQELVSYIVGAKQETDQRFALITKLRTTLENRRYLIILEEVTTPTEMDYFIHGGGSCAHVVTTQKSEIMRHYGGNDALISVNEMDEGEAVELLRSAIADCPDSDPINAEYKSLAVKIGFVPLYLRLASNLLSDYVNCDTESRSTEAKILNAFGILNSSLNESGLSALGDRVAATIEPVLKQLPDNDQVRYRDLAVFAKGKTLPLGSVYGLWASKGDIGLYGVLSLCRDLYKRSLLKEFNPTSRTIKMHSLFAQYLIEQQQRFLPELDNRLLNSYGFGTEWHRVFEEADRYIQEHVGFHLKRAGRHAELASTVKDWRYLMKKTVTPGFGPSEVALDIKMAAQLDPVDTLLPKLLRVFENSEQCFNGAPRKKEAKVYSRLQHLRGSINGMPSQVPSESPPQISLRIDFPDLRRKSRTDGARYSEISEQEEIKSCSYHPGLECVVTTSQNSVKLWDLKSARITDQLDVNGFEPITACAMSFDGTYVVCARGDVLKFWNIGSSEFSRTFAEHRGTINSCVFSRDGNRLVTASADKTLVVWNVERNFEISVRLERQADLAWNDDWHQFEEINVTVDGHNGYVKDGAFSLDGCSVISVSEDSSVRRWDLSSDPIRASTLYTHSFAVNACAVSTGGKLMVSASTDKKLFVRSLQTGQQWELAGHDEKVNDCGFSLDDQFIVSASSDGTIRVWFDTVSEEARFREVASFYDQGEMLCCLMVGKLIFAGGTRGAYFLELFGDIDTNGDTLILI